MFNKIKIGKRSSVIVFFLSSFKYINWQEYKSISPVFEEDIYEAISMETCVNKRLTIGAPGEEAMKKVLAIYEKYLAECDKING